MTSRRISASKRESSVSYFAVLTKLDGEKYAVNAEKVENVQERGTGSLVVSQWLDTTTTSDLEVQETVEQVAALLNDI